MPPARVHILYVESAEDQRGPDGKRLPGLHLGVPGLGPALCATCNSVGDSWRGRCDNFQCALRMCCAEGALFRPFVSQIALLSPRAAVNYSLPKLGAWMSASGHKRPNEALVLGAALRAADTTLPPLDDGVVHAALHGADRAEASGMWEWAAAWARAIQGSASGRTVSILLDAAAPALVPSTSAGAASAALGRGAGSAPISDLIFVLGGPSGIPARWHTSLVGAVGDPLKVALRGGLAHSAPALLELLLLHERAELVPLLLDREALSPAQHKAWRKAEREMQHAWLRSLGIHPEDADGGGGTSEAAAAGARGGGGAASERFDAVLQAHRTAMARLGEGRAMATPRAAPAPTGGKRKRKMAAK